MPRKTLALIAGLVLVTVILFIIAVKTGQQEKTPVPSTTTQATPTPDVAHAVLAMSPNPVTVASGQQGTVDVTLDAADDLVTGVELEIAYDPTVVSNVKVVYGSMFPNPLVLFNKNDAVKGHFTYGYGIQPGQKPVTGTGTVAKITFTASGTTGKEAQISLLPTTLISARGVRTSVLKSTSGTTVMIGSGAGATTTTNNEMIMQHTTLPVASVAPTK